MSRVVYPQVVEHHGLFPPDIIVLDQDDDTATISYEQTPLFHFGQTVPYRAGKRTLAYFAFEDIFFKYSRKNSWIRKTNPRTGEELDDWYSESECEYTSRPDQKNRLTSKLIQQHINQRQIIGVKSTEWTRYVLIDLDYHERDLEVFLAQAEALLSRFHGYGTWHYQIKIGEVSGLQLIYVFEKPILLEEVITETRRQLTQLDDQHPDLVTKAKTAGMRTLADLEVYPTQTGNGVRLPLCRNREMLLDGPLPLLLHRKNQVQDVEEYIRWLSDPKRQYMPKDRILGHLRDNAAIPLMTQPKVSKSVVCQNRKLNKGWRGNLRRWMHEFWLQGNANGLPLNEHIVVLSRLAAAYGYSAPEIEKGLKTLVRGLPACAIQCSSRLIKKKYRQIDGVIRSSAKYACDQTGHQPDNRRSVDIFHSVLIRCPDFDPMDSSSWLLPVQHKVVHPIWNNEQHNCLCTTFRKVLFVNNNDLIMRFINGIVNLTLVKESQSHGWGKGYLLKWMITNFPEIKCAKSEKRLRIINCLEQQGIIEAVTRGKPGYGCTKWKLGKVALEAVNADDECSQILPSPTMPLY